MSRDFPSVQNQECGGGWISAWQAIAPALAAVPVHPAKPCSIAFNTRGIKAPSGKGDGGVLGQWVTGVRAFSPPTEATSKAGDRRAIGIVPHLLPYQAGGAAVAPGRGARFVLARGPESADNIVSRVSRPCAARRRGAWFWRRVPFIGEGFAHESVGCILL